MKVLVISHMYPSSQNQAYGVFVHKQVKALKEQGCDVRVISPVPHAPWPLSVLKKKWQAYASVPRRDLLEGVEVCYPRYLEFPESLLLQHSGYFMYRGIRKLAAGIFREFKFDLIHAHVALPDGHSAFLLKREYDIPLIVTIHGQDFQSTIHKGDACRARLFQILNGTDWIITVSSKLKRIVKDQPFFEKITVIHNGIDPEDLTEADRSHIQQSSNRSETGSETGQIKLVSVSNLKKTKGIDLNIQAVSALIVKYPNLKYYIIGDGEERQNLENLVDRLNLREYVVFLGKLPHPDAMKQIASADIFSLPSWQEGFGVVYIEAMAQGVPVIGVRGEGIADVIRHGENGLLVRPQHVEDLTEALASLLDDPHYRKTLADAGRNTVLQNLTWSDNAKRTMEAYRQVLA